MHEQPNQRLSDVIDETGLSALGFAHRVGGVAAEWGLATRPSHTQVGRWCAGQVPRPETQRLIAETLARKLGRPVTLQEIGFHGMPEDAGAELDYLEDLGRALELSVGLWRADVRQITVINTAVATSTVSSAALSWLLDAATPTRKRDVGTREVTEFDVEGVRSTAAVFAGLDNRFGGRHARLTAVQYLDDQVARLLQGRYSDVVGKSLFTAVAEFSLCVAWMAYDSGQHNLARRYFVQALGLAKHAGDRRLGASVLSALSHQANLVGDLTAARDLARAARQAAQHSGSHTLQAQFAAMEARALASLQDRASTLHALGQAEEHFALRDSESDPAWILYFDDGELAAEAAHCHLELAEFPVAAARLASASTAGPSETARSDAFAGIVRVESLIGAGELEEAAAIAAGVLSTCATVGSARIDVYLRRLRARIGSVGSTRALRDVSVQLEQVQTARARRWPTA